MTGNAKPPCRKTLSGVGMHGVGCRCFAYEATPRCPGCRDIADGNDERRGDVVCEFCDSLWHVTDGCAPLEPVSQ